MTYRDEAETMRAELDRVQAEQIRALHAFGEALAIVARSGWCTECRGTRSAVVAGVEEDCDRCDALGVVAENEGEP